MSSLTQAEFVPMTSVKDQLLDALKDSEYRAEFVRERVKSSIALQIRALREQREHMTQKELGEAIGMAQTWVSKLENPEYGKMTVATLLRLATDAFDTDLEIKFRPFSETLDVVPNQGPEYFRVPSFSDELEMLEREREESPVSDALMLLASGREQVHVEQLGGNDRSKQDSTDSAASLPLRKPATVETRKAA
jgi:transcriptional regulator with XRE-family HTH domain